MADSSPGEASSNLRLKQGRAVILRWCLLAGVALAVTTGRHGIGILDAEARAVLVRMARFNVHVHWRARAGDAVDATELFGQSCVDLTALAMPELKSNSPGIKRKLLTRPTSR